MRRTRSGFLTPMMACLRSGTFHLMLGRAQSGARRLMVGRTRSGACRLMTDRTQSGPSSYELVRKRIGASRVVRALARSESLQTMMDRIEGAAGRDLGIKSVQRRNRGPRGRGFAVSGDRAGGSLHCGISSRGRGELLDLVSMTLPAKANARP
jgi:hypothetical protein